MSNFNDPNPNDPHLGKIPSGVNLLRRRRRFRLTYVIAIGASCVLVTCLGCCILAALFLQAERFEGPAGANDVASRITDWQLPPGFTGVYGATADNALMKFDIAKFDHDQGRGTLVIAQIRWKLGNNSQSREMTEDLIKRFVPELRKIEETHCETRASTIRSKSATFKICQGEDLASTTKLRQINGHFLGKTANVVLMFQIEDGVVSDKELDEFIQSIH